MALMIVDAQVQQQFSKRLKDLRHDAGMRQLDVAHALNVRRKSISHYEVGKRLPDIVRLSQLADLFDCTTDYLLGRTAIKEDWATLLQKYGSNAFKVAETP